MIVCSWLETVGGAGLAYNTGDDTWSRVTAPPMMLPQPTLEFLGQRVFGLDKYVVEPPAPLTGSTLGPNH